jgi:rhodanese-related sulfurtransferase
MFGFLKKLLGGSDVDIKSLVAQGAQVVDVRTPGEFKSGHIKGAINVPLDALKSQMGKISKDKPVITCCQSGRRSGIAKGILTQAGYDVHNGGGWASLQSKLS